MLVNLDDQSVVPTAPDHEGRRCRRAHTNSDGKGSNCKPNGLGWTRDEGAQRQYLKGKEHERCSEKIGCPRITARMQHGSKIWTRMGSRRIARWRTWGDRISFLTHGDSSATRPSDSNSPIRTVKNTEMIPHLTAHEKNAWRYLFRCAAPRNSTSSRRRHGPRQPG